MFYIKKNMRTYINYYLIIVISLIAISCSNEEVSNLLDNPKEFAKITFKIVDIGNNNKKLSKLFEKM
jgi:hypothetical protein